MKNIISFFKNQRPGLISLMLLGKRAAPENYGNIFREIVLMSSSRKGKVSLWKYQ